MTLSLRQRILWWSVASTLVIVLAVFFFVDRSFRTTIRAGLEENVAAGARLAAELQRSEVEEGVDRAATLAGAPTLRAAVETGDPPTIAENLEALLEESEMDWLAVTDPDGRVLATAGPVDRARIETARALVSEARFYDTGDLWRQDESLVEVHVGGIFFGTELLGLLFSGQRIGPERVERLELSSQQQIVLLSDGRLVAGSGELSAEEREALVSAWADAEPAPAVEAAAGSGVPDADARREFEMGGSRYVGAAVALPGSQRAAAGQLVAFRSLDQALAPARRLRLTLLAIAVAGILLAFAFSYVLSRSVTRPVNRLLKETVRVGSGDLEHSVEPERDDEIGELARGFESMRSSLLDARTELVRAERLSAVGRAASAIVHDFAQPVNVIQGNVELLEYDWDDPEARSEDVRIIRRELERLTTMMQEILDFARGEDRIRTSPGSVPELLDDVARRARPLVEGQDVELDVEHGYRGEWSLDFPRTTRVIENLVRNAAAAIGADGHIRIRSELRDGNLVIEVEDDGPGIPQDLRENLFEPFVTHGKKEGTGLGLAIARSFTERQGGTIRFETSEAGTTFVLEFPGNGQEES